MRPAIDVARISLLLVVGGAIAVTTGCAPVGYRVPGIEVQRLARLDPAARGYEVRIVPRTAPLTPAISPQPELEPELDPAPPPPPVAIEEAPMIETSPVDPAPPYGAPVSVQVNVPMTLGARAGHRIWLPRFHGRHHSGYHRGGGGRGNPAAAAAVGVVAVVGLVAAVAVAADHAQRVDVARSYDGWVAVAPNHPVRLHYPGNLVRIVALDELRMDDTIGLQYAVLRASEGAIQHLGRAPGAGVESASAHFRK